MRACSILLVKKERNLEQSWALQHSSAFGYCTQVLTIVIFLTHHKSIHKLNCKNVCFNTLQPWVNNCNNNPSMDGKHTGFFIDVLEFRSPLTLSLWRSKIDYVQHGVGVREKRSTSPSNSVISGKFPKIKRPASQVASRESHFSLQKQKSCWILL